MKAKRTIVVLVGVLTFSVSTALSQSPASSDAPAEEIRSLGEALSGQWSLSVKWEPDSATPNGLTNTGEETWRKGPGGYTLVEEEHLRFPKKDAFLLGIVWWDGTTKSLHGMECQNELPFTCDLKGALNDITMSWDGKQFVINEIEDKTSLWHEVYSDITPTSFTQIGEYGPRGGGLKRLFTIHATRSRQ
jgi:hypothetical protein